VEYIDKHFADRITQADFATVFKQFAGDTPGR